MCYFVEYQNENLSSVQELRAAGLVVKSEHYPHYEDNVNYKDEEYCLCNTDIESILEDNNLQFEEMYYGAYRILKS